MNARKWIVAVFGLAALQVAAGLIGSAVAAANGASVSPTVPLWVFPLQMLVFSGAAVVLAAGGQGDLRAIALSGVFALIAASFSRRPAYFLETQFAYPLPLTLLRGLRVDALLPVFVWLFFREFPRSIATPRARLLARAALGVALGCAVVLICGNLLLALGGTRLSMLRSLDPGDRHSPYWGIVYGLTLSALPFAAWRVRSAPADERRRAAFFAAGIIAAALPYSLFVLAHVLSESFAKWVAADGRDLVIPFVELLILSIPITIAYAILVDRLLPVRVLLRNALRHLLARGVVTAGALLPFLWIAWYVWPRRGEPLSAFIVGPRGLAIAGALAFGSVAMRVRHQARNVIDRTFFREAYDARRTLLAVAERSRRVARAPELADLLASEIDRALHLESIAILFVDPIDGWLRPASGLVRPVVSDSPLAMALSRIVEPLEVDLEKASSPLRALPQEDRHWLADGAIRLLVPMRSTEDELIGVIALGGKRSELPFNGEDRQLLAAIGAAGAITLEGRLKRATPSAQGVRDDVAELSAALCARCLRIDSASAGFCGDCRCQLEAVAVPLVLQGKFRLERRIGEGGMGVVYLARDLELGRPVAIKTLPRSSPEDAVRLRREARAMAAVQHPNLAVIYAAETWKGTPLLITEYLDAGTLADRILPGRLALKEARGLGIVLADALERVHRAGILHGDLKPSNIGYTAEGVPKVLDFGLARVLGEADAVLLSVESLPGDTVFSSRTTVSRQGIVGTPLYMSPEAVRGEPPDTLFDLWSLAVVLYEAIAGRSPVERPSWIDTLDAIQHGKIPDLREDVPEATVELAGFFDKALSAESRQRPGSAGEFRRRWQEACRGVA